MKNPNSKQICRHFGVATYRLNQDLNAGFLIECIPFPRKGMPRRWDEKAFIATHFYFDLQDQGMSRREASRVATAIAVFAERNPDEKYCAIMRRKGFSLEVLNFKEVPAPQDWNEDISSVSFFNIEGAKQTYQSAFF